MTASPTKHRSGATMTRIADLQDRLLRLARRREDEGIYTDANLVEAAASRIAELEREYLNASHDAMNLAGKLNAAEAELAKLRQGGEPVAYQQRESRDDGKTWSDWYPTTREAFEEYTRNVASRYVSGKWTFEARALYAHPPAQAGAVTEAMVEAA